MSKNKCSIDGCDKNIHANNLCMNHYRIFKQTSIQDESSESKYRKKCIVDECVNNQYAKELCEKHYQKNKLYGNPTQKHVFEKEKECSVEECFSKRYGKGYCKLHHGRLRHYGDPLFIPPKRTKSICSIDECNSFVEGKGYCKKHYNRFKTHGDPLYVGKRKERESHGMRHTPEYGIWKGMKGRCFNENTERYHCYGGRGITVCDRWVNSFFAFYEDMGKRPEGDYQIDRIDNDGNYEPSNCKWVLRLDNIRHTSKTKLSLEMASQIRQDYLINGISIEDLSLEYHVVKATIRDVINNKTWRND